MRAIGKHVIGLLTFVALLLPGVAVQAGEVGEVVGDVAKQVFKETERQLIREYFDKHGIEGDGRDDESDGRGNGKGKHGKKEKGAKGKGNKGLPPGIAMKLERGGTLPPGIAKRSLPDDLERRLPPPPRGMERLVIDGKVVLVETATQIVRDVISDLIN